MGERFHQDDDVNVRALLICVIAFVVLGIVLHMAMSRLFKHYIRADARNDPGLPTAIADRHPGPPEPRLQPTRDLHESLPADDWLLIKQETDKALSGYRWIDRKNGVVGIPIDQAMNMTISRGLLKAATRPGGQP